MLEPHEDRMLLAIEELKAVLGEGFSAIGEELRAFNVRITSLEKVVLDQDKEQRTVRGMALEETLRLRRRVEKIELHVFGEVQTDESPQVDG